MPTSTLGDRWRVDAVLPGAMGSVLVVTDPATGDRFAAKTPRVDRDLDARARRSFEAEARTWLSLGHHENVVEALFLEEIEYAGGVRPFLFLEFVDGITLQRALEVEGRLALPVVLDIATGMAWGMAHAHGEAREGPRIIHRDLKPENVFLTRDRLVKVSDFGIARALDRPEDHATEGVGLGTPYYSAPEQMKDARSAGPRSDVYSFGAVIHHLLTGEPPFPAESLSELVMKVLRDPPPAASALAPDVPEALDRLLAACLAKEPAGRPSSFDDVLAEISEIREIDALWTPSSEAHSCAACGWLSLAAVRTCVVCEEPLEAAHRYAPVSSRHTGRSPTLGRTAAGSLRIEGMEARPRVARAGEQVRITLLLGNPGSRPVDQVFVPFALPDRDAFARADGRGRGFRGSVPPTAPNAPIRVSWLIRALRPGSFRIAAPKASHRLASGERVTAHGEPLALRVLPHARLPFVGRERELAEVLACLDGGGDRAEPGAALVAVLGRPGMGKSRLGHEVWRRAAARGHGTARGRSLGRGVETRGALKEALRKLVGLPRGVRGPTEVASAVLGLLGRHAPRGLVDFLVDELVGAPVARNESPGRMWSRVAVLLASRKPFLLLLEDIHRDLDVAHLAIDMAAHAQREKVPFAVMLSGRAALADDPAGSELLRRIENEPHGIGCTRIVRLEPLAREAVHRLLAGAFEPNDFDTSAPWLASTVHAGTGGNPLFVAELVRALRADARLVEARDGRYTAGPDLAPERVAGLVPARTEELVLSGLRELPDAARRFVLAAGVLGDVFDTALLDELLGHPADFAESLSLLEAADVLREVPGRPPRIRFREPVLPEILRRELQHRDLDEFRRLHDRAASLLASRPDSGREYALRLARHLAAAGRGAEALPMLIAAGWRMAVRQSSRLAACCLGEAERLLDEGGVAPGPAERVELDMLRGEVLRFTGEFQRSLEAYRRVIDAPPGDHVGAARLATAHSKIGKVHEALGELDQALEGYTVGLSLRRQADDRVGVALSLANLAGLHLVRGDGERAEHFVELALVAGTDSGSARALGRAHALRARLLVGRGETAAARPALRRALRLARAAHDASTVAEVWSVLGNANARDGRPRRAIRYFRRALHMRQEAGDVPAVAAAWNNLGVVQEGSGDLEAAGSAYGRAVELYARIGSRRGRGTSLANLGRLRRDEGHPRTARELLSDAAAAHDDAGDPIAAAATLAELARTENALGDLACATDTVRRALRLAEGRTDHDTRARVALARAELGLRGPPDPAVVEELRAAGRLPGLTPRLRTSVLALLAEIEGDAEVAAAAVRAAAAAGDPRIRARALATEGRLGLARGAPEEAAALLRRAAGLLLQSEVRDPLLYWVLRDTERALRDSDPAAASAAGRRAEELASVLRARGFDLAESAGPA